MSQTPLVLHWRDEGDPASLARASRRRLVVSLLAIVGILLAIVLLGLPYLTPPTRAVFVPLFIHKYRDPGLQELPWRMQDEKVLSESGYFTDVRDVPGARLDQGTIVAALDALRKTAFHQAVLVYLSGRARLDFEGRVQIYPADADPDDPSTWLPLAKVLEKLSQAGAQDRVLFLDLIPPAQGVRPTLLQDDIGAGIVRDVQAVPDSRRMVIAASASGQRSWTSEVFESSIFAHYLDEGIRGQADADNNGQVSARELGNYVQAHADRWARQARGTRQTPLVLGEGDFGLLDLPNGVPRPYRMLPEERVYPGWLQQARGKATSRAARQELFLLEHNWRSGEAADKVKAAVPAALALTDPTPPAGPPARSLAQALQGKEPAPDLIDRLRQLTFQSDARTSGLPADKATPIQAQLIEDFLKASKEPPPLIEKAALVVVGLDPRPVILDLMAMVVRRLEPDPRYVETLTLLRLVSRGIPGAVAQRVLEVVEAGETAAARAAPYPWVQGELEAALQTRHEALVVQASSGYAPLTEATTLLARAGSQATGVLALQGIAQNALDTRDRARRVLPDTLLYLQFAAEANTAWLDAVKQTVALSDRLDALRGSGLASHVDEVRRLFVALQASLDALDEPFSASGVDRLVRASKRASATGSVWRQVNGLLTSDRLADRATVWQAQMDLTRRLEEEVSRLDRVEGTRPLEVTAWVAPNPNPAAQARVAIALLELAGMTQAARQALPKDISDLQQALQTGWQQLPVPRPDTGLWAFLADRYRYERRDWGALDPQGPAAVFTAQAARDYAPWLTAPREDYIDLSEASDPPRLLPGASITQRLEVRLSAGPSVPRKVDLRLVAPNTDWLSFTPQGQALAPPPDGESNWLVPVRVELLSSAGQGTSVAPEGLLATASMQNGRTFHHRMKVPLSPRTPKIVLAPTALSATPDLASVRLRTVPGQQAVYLYVTNPIEKPWKKLVVRLLTSDRTQESAPFALAGKASQLVRFPVPTVPATAPPAPPPAGAPAAPAGPSRLPELQGGLQFELVDEDGKSEVIARRTVGVDLSAPDEYVSITGVLFDPAGGKNRLTVRSRLRRTLAGPPVRVELSFAAPEDGGATYTDGTLKGVLPANGDELVLYADGVQSSSGKALFFVSVDGWARAFVFNATLSTAGAVTPGQVFVPAVRPRVPAAALSGPALSVPVEVDNAPSGSSLDLSLGRILNGMFTQDELIRRDSPRHKQIGFQASGPGGALIFDASLNDWVLKLDTGLIRGPRELRVRLLNREKVQIAQAVRTLSLGNLPPSGVAFVNPPKKLWRALPLVVQAQGGDGTVGIKAANFFLGRPIEEKLPPGIATVPGTPLDSTRTLWGAKLTLPADKKGPQDVSVQFVNNVGLSSFATFTLDVLDADPTKNLPATIKGTVMKGSYPQPNLDVSLLDAKGTTEIKKTKTAADGTFSFTDLPAGKYRLKTAVSYGRVGVWPRKATDTIDLAAGATDEVEIPMFLP